MYGQNPQKSSPAPRYFIAYIANYKKLYLALQANL